MAAEEIARPKSPPAPLFLGHYPLLQTVFSCYCCFALDPPQVLYPRVGLNWGLVAGPFSIAPYCLGSRFVSNFDAHTHTHMIPAWQRDGAGLWHHKARRNLHGRGHELLVDCPNPPQVEGLLKIFKGLESRGRKKQ